MTKTQWKIRFYSTSDRTYSTADAGEMALSSDRDGVAERAESTADNTLQALCRLVEMLHGKGILNTAEVQHVLVLHAYEPVGDE
jgi:hypothetical protein